MARRVGSAKAEKAALRFEAASISAILYKTRLIVKKKFSPPLQGVANLLAWSSDRLVASRGLIDGE